jgi:hypothetical protein
MAKDCWLTERFPQMLLKNDMHASSLPLQMSAVIVSCTDLSTPFSQLQARDVAGTLTLMRLNHPGLLQATTFV